MVTDTLYPGKMVTKGSTALSTLRLVRKLNSRRKPPYALTVPHWGWDQGKAGTCILRGILAGVGVIPEKPVNLP